MNDQIELKARYAAELITAMGGGKVYVLIDDGGEVRVVAVAPGDRTEAQLQADRLLAHLQRKYRIVKD